MDEPKSDGENTNAVSAADSALKRRQQMNLEIEKRLKAEYEKYR